MNPAQVTKVNVPIRLTEQRELAPPATVKTTVRLAGTTPSPTVDSIDGQRPANVIDAYAILLRTRADQKSLLLRFADGKQQRVAVGPVPTPDAILEARKRFGLTIEPLTPLLAEKYHLSSDDGLFITEVAKDSIAQRAGLEAGDVIVQLGRYRVSSLSDFSALLHRLPETGRVRIGIIRGEQSGFGMLEL
jgi:membrane-associated protease RseP (regulator of RpoE activity)